MTGNNHKIICVRGRKITNTVFYSPKRCYNIINNGLGEDYGYYLLEKINDNPLRYRILKGIRLL